MSDIVVQFDYDECIYLSEDGKRLLGREEGIPLPTSEEDAVSFIVGMLDAAGISTIGVTRKGIPLVFSGADSCDTFWGSHGCSYKIDHPGEHWCDCGYETNDDTNTFTMGS